MDKKLVDSILYDLTPRSWTDVRWRMARDQFMREMRDKQYGPDALANAWGWFLAGWEGRTANVIAHLT